MSAKEAYPEILREFHRMVLLPHELVTLVSGSIVVLMLSGADQHRPAEELPHGLVDRCSLLALIAMGGHHPGAQ